MLWRRGSRAAERDTRVWLLGRAHPSADRSIGWNDDPFPNLSDPDALVVDLATLTAPVLERIGKAKLDQAQQLIRDKTLNGGTVIVITHPLFWADPPLTPNKSRLSTPDLSAGNPGAYSNYDIFPTRLATKNVPDGEAINVDDGHDFKKYMDNVRKFSFYIRGYSPRVVSKIPGSLTNIELTPVRGQGVRDNSGHDLGLTLVAATVDHYHQTADPLESTGRLVFLPPPPAELADKAIETLLAIFGKGTPRAKAPTSGRPAPARPVEPTSASAGRPGAQAATRQQAAGPAVAESGPPAGRPPPPTAEEVGQGGGAGTAGTAPGGAGSPAAAAAGGTDAFLSYHHEAKDGVARPLADGLEKRCVTVWWDSTAMKISDTLSDKIREGLNGARCGVVIVSKEYLDSAWGQTELGAMFLKNFPIFPILHGVSAEEAQKKLPALSGKVMRPWDGRPEPLMDEIADTIKEDRGGRVDQNGPSAPAPHGAPPEHGIPSKGDAALSPGKTRPRAAGPPKPTRPAPRAPDRNHLGPDAVGMLSSRNVWHKDSADFAKNPWFDLLHGGALSGPKKPVFLFTACLHDPPVPGVGVPLELPGRDELPARVKVDGQDIPLLGIDRLSDTPLIAIEKCGRAPPGADILMYRELHPHGLCEWGASGMFIDWNSRNNIELRMCHMVGEFWAFLAYTRLAYAALGLDAPFTALVSIRNAGGLVLGNYGNEVFSSSWDIHKHWSFSPADPGTNSVNIQWRRAFASTSEATDGAIAQTAREMAGHVCMEYGEGAPRCYGADGAFHWKLWWKTRRETLRGCLP